MFINSTHTIELLPDEYWYGGCVSDGILMPFNNTTVYNQSLHINQTSNQAVPLLISNKGRYLWSEYGFDYSFDNGLLLATSSQAEIYLYEGFETLRGAFLNAAQSKFNLQNKVPPKVFFDSPQYNTWIELMYDQNQKSIMEYVSSLIENEMPVGILIIDCGWADYYGSFDFHSGKFPDPKGLVEWLHNKGFKVMLWESPFVSPDSVVFRWLDSQGFLIKDKTGEPAIKHWWDGYSAVIDLTNPGALEWLHDKNKKLIENYGIDGFKMDAGDSKYYDFEDVTYAKTTPNEHCELWARFGLEYPYNEYRACFKCCGEPLVQRLADKCHSWREDGLQSLIPNVLAQGILGYPYTCPDMIGGGEYLNFMTASKSIDQNLVVRYAQCSALMPMMQYSAAPWRILNKEIFDLCKATAFLHKKFGDYIYQLSLNASKTGEPIVRYMEYAFPHQGFAPIKDQFMLGDRILVAPIIIKDMEVRRIIFPKGEWEDVEGEIIIGPCVKDFAVTIESLPYFTRIDL